MNVLVTGHLGYIGSVLTPLLSAAGHSVTGLDSGLFTSGHLGPLPPVVANKDCDIRDVSSNQLAGFDAVIHLAGISNDPLGDLDPTVTLDINHLATVRLAQLCRNAKVERFLFASSCSLYGAGSDQVLDENATLKPLTPYGESKALSERDLMELASEHFSPVYLRCATAYGLSPRLRSDLVVNDLTIRAAMTGEVTLLSDGTAWRPLIHVEDIARAFIGLLEAPRKLIHNQAFNVGHNDENYRITDVAKLIREAVDGSQVCYSPNASRDQRCYAVDCSKLQSVIPKHSPQWTVAKGIPPLLHAVRTSGYDFARLRGPDFLRLVRIKQLLDAGDLDPNLRLLRQA
ncbi:MAG: NAD-dependent epimerase/dehydratase family protein [Oceanococcus sp.]